MKEQILKNYTNYLGLKLSKEIRMSSKNGYVYITVNELEELLNQAKTSKSNKFKNIVSNISQTIDKQNEIDSLKFISAAETKFSKIKADASNPEVVLFDEDANISLLKDGAYVQAWLWVDNSDIKVKKTSRRKSTAV
jgi:hypothetical protein